AEHHVAALKKLQVPWSVNTLAQQLGVVALEQLQFAAATKQWLAEELPWFTSELEHIGLQPFPSVTNYMLVRIPEKYGISSEELQALMGMEGILIRDGARFRGLDSSYIRLAIKDRESNERMLQVLASILYRK